MMEANLFPRQQTLLGATSAPMSLYVATTGDDDTGEGTALNPYATVERAYADLPEKLKHECKILVEAGNYASGWPKEIAPQIEDEGSLSIVGVGVPSVVSGPWTVTGVADLGTGGQRLTIAAGGLGAVDSLCGQMVMIATGGHVGEVYRVGANTDTTIDLVLVTDKVHNADTFNLVNPAVKIASDGADILYDSVSVPGWNGGTFESTSQRLVIHNIWLDLSASTTPVDVLQIRGRQGRGGLSLDFMRIDLPATVYGGMIVCDCLINSTGSPFSSDYITDGATGIANLGCHTRAGLSVTGTGNRAALMMYVYGRTDIVDLAVKGAVVCYQGEVGIVRLTAGTLNLYGHSRQRVGTFLIEGKAGSVAMGITAPEIELDSGYVVKATDAVKLQMQCRCSLTGMSCDATSVTVAAMSIAAGCTVVQKGALANFVGASAGGDKAFRFTVDGGAVKADVWMAANYGTASDTKGATIIRED